MKAKTKKPSAQTVLLPPDCIALLGGALCGLCMIADIKDVREAVQWWARNRKSWDHFGDVRVAYNKAAQK